MRIIQESWLIVGLRQGFAASEPLEIVDYHAHVARYRPADRCVLDCPVVVDASPDHRERMPKTWTLRASPAPVTPW